MPRITRDGAVLRGTPAPPPSVTNISVSRRLENWLAAFLDYTKDLESPTNYLRWAGLSTIAAAAQRKIYMESQAFFAFTNMYIVLVGPPGSKKSTAIRAGRRLLKQVPGINLSSDAPSIVGIMQDFADIPQKDHQSLNAFMGELSTLFENSGDGMTGFMTHLYDGDPDYIKRTRIGGKESIPYPWLNLLGGTTPSWLGNSLTPAMIEGGLVARTIYVYSDEINLKSPFPKPSDQFRSLEKDLVHDLAIISQLYGEFDFDGSANGQAYRWYEAWYMDPTRFPRVTDNRTAGYYSRKPMHLLKVAMAVSLSRSNSLRLSTEDLEIAKALLEKVEPGMRRAFSAVGGNIFATDIERVYNQIHGCGAEGMTYPELVASNYHQLEQKRLDEVLMTLASIGRIMQPPPDKRNGRLVRWYRASDLSEWG